MSLIKNITINGNSESISTVDLNKLIKEIEQLNKCVELERRKYNKYSIIKDVAMSCTTEESCLPTELQSKVYEILMADDVEQCLQLTPNDTLLGLPHRNTELTYEEKELIRNAVQKGIIKKSRKLFEELEELGIECNRANDLTHSVLGISVEDKVLMDYKRELNEKQSLYISQLEELISVLKEILELKSKTLPESTNNKTYACEIELRLLQLQSQVMNAKVTVDIFTETSSSMDAYRQLLKDICQQQTDCKQEIEKLRELKEKYKQVSCKQYNEILRNYVKYKSIIENKRDFLNRLNEK
ncbi:hypothetical protein RI129_008650 [Pyrocoelia pectoralis]|uniref:Uncharacterized protein n=1 Tax=Pyrocoelia pectoralis TaxID=417401 RepID=A0AAN7VBQ3_9COLE